jgi:hypothetical protein
VAERSSVVDVVLDCRGVWWLSQYWAESFEAWWDGELVGRSTYTHGMTFQVACVPGVCILEFLPQHTHGAVQRFRIELPGGRWVLRSTFVVGFWSVGWSEPRLKRARDVTRA